MSDTVLISASKNNFPLSNDIKTEYFEGVDVDTYLFRSVLLVVVFVIYRPVYIYN